MGRREGGRGELAGRPLATATEDQREKYMFDDPGRGSTEKAF